MVRERAFQLCVAKIENLILLRSYRLKGASVVSATIADVERL